MKTYYKKLSQSNLVDILLLCKVNGLVENRKDRESMIQKIVALEEYKIRKTLKVSSEGLLSNRS